MKNAEILDIFRSLVVKSYLNDDPSLSKDRLKEIEIEINDRVKLDTPLSEVGLDSMKMTWIIVKFEEILDIDASGVSFFELFDVNDLANEIIEIVKEKS